MLYAVLAVSDHRARPRRLARCRGGQGASRRRRGDHAREPAAAGAGPGRQDQSVHVPARAAAERRGALCQPADRGRDRRDAGGRDRGRAPARAALRDRARPRSALDAGGKLRAADRRPRLSGRRRIAATSRPGLPRAAKTIDATYETPAQYHNRDGAACDRRRMGRRQAVDRHAEPGSRDGAGAPCRIVRHSARERFISAARSSAAASARKGYHFGTAGSRRHRGRALVGRPVKLVLRRDQMFGPVGHRAPTRQTPAPRRRRRRRADRARSSRPRRVQHLRRLLRAGRQRLANALCQPGDRDLA